jgi:hypothetical protein
MKVVTADARVFDADGRLIATQTEASPRHFVAPGERAPVVFIIKDPAKRAARFNVTFSGPLGEREAPITNGPTVRVHQSGGIGNGQGIWVEARVENPTPTPAEVTVILTFRHSNGTIVGLKSGPPEPNPVPPRGGALYRGEIYALGGSVGSLDVALDQA